MGQNGWVMCYGITDCCVRLEYFGGKDLGGGDKRKKDTLDDY